MSEVEEIHVDCTVQKASWRERVGCEWVKGRGKGVACRWEADGMGIGIRYGRLWASESGWPEGGDLRLWATGLGWYKQ